MSLLAQKGQQVFPGGGGVVFWEHMQCAWPATKKGTPQRCSRICIQIKAVIASGKVMSRMLPTGVLASAFPVSCSVLSFLRVKAHCGRGAWPEAAYNKEYAKQYERDAEQLAHIQGHSLFKAYLVLLYKLNHET